MTTKPPPEFVEWMQRRSPHPEEPLGPAAIAYFWERSEHVWRAAIAAAVSRTKALPDKLGLSPREMATWLAGEIAAEIEKLLKGE
jgi:hypothetical protein